MLYLQDYEEIKPVKYIKLSRSTIHKDDMYTYEFYESNNLLPKNFNPPGPPPFLG